MKTFPIHIFKAQISAILKRVTQGEEVIIAKGKKPIAIVKPIGSVHKREFGAMKGEISIGDEFFEELPENELKAWE